MKTLKEFIYEGCCSKKQSAMRKKCSGKRCKRIKESADVTFGMTYPDANFGTVYNDAVYNKNKVKNPNTALKMFLAIGDLLTEHDGYAYQISLEVYGLELIACMPEKELWSSESLRDREVVKILKQNCDDIADAIIEWCDEEMGWDDIPERNELIKLLKSF